MFFFFSFLDIIVYLVQEYTCNYIDMPKKRGTSITPKTAFAYSIKIFEFNSFKLIVTSFNIHYIIINIIKQNKNNFL